MRGPGPSRVVHEQGAFAPTGGHAAFPVGWRNGEDWSAHIPKLVDVWAGRLLGAPGYHGNPVGTHQPVLHRFPFGTAELARGLERWEETVDELFIGEIAELAKERARLAVGAIVTLVRRDTADLEPVSCGGRAG